LEKLLAFAFVSLLLSGCCCIAPQVPGEETPTPVPGVTYAATATVTPAPTPTPRATATPSPTPAITPPPANYSRIEARVFELTNQERQRAGLSQFAPDDALTNAARWQSCCLAVNNILAHESEQCGSVDGRLMMFGVMQEGAENIGQVPDAPSYYASTWQPTRLYSDDEVASRIVTGWMNSPPHRANILDPRYTHLGVGICKGGERGHYFYGTQNFIISSGCGYGGQPCCEEFGGYSCYLPATCDMGTHTCGS